MNKINILKRGFCLLLGTLLLCKIYGQNSVNTTLNRWNKLTLQSLDLQAKSTEDATQKKIYENRKIALRQYLRIDSVNSHKSVRYDFIKQELRNLKMAENDFYVVEANESDSKILIRNFTVYFKSKNTVVVDFYEYVNGGWVKTGDYVNDSLSSIGNFDSNIVPFGRGFNYDDIIISEFKNKAVRKSNYYLYSTLSVKSMIKIILDGYKRKKLYKSL